MRFAHFIDTHLLAWPRPQRIAALADLAEIVRAAKTEERRRICGSRNAYIAAQAITQDEIDRHVVPTRGR